MRYIFLLLFSLLSVKSNAQYISLNFDGSDDWVTGTNNSLPQGNAPRTIETWIKYSTSKNDMSVFNYGTFSFNQKFTLHLYNGVYIIGEGNDLSTGYHFNDGNWHHLAVTHNGVTTVVYVDGIIRGSRNTTYNTTGFDFQMGVSLRNGSWDFRFEGNIDELRVWNVARTQQELIDNMYTPINTAPGLIASYHFNDGIPNGDNRAVTHVADATGNGNDGTLNNFALIGFASNFVDDGIVLPLRLLGFTAVENNCAAHITWKTSDESNMLLFVVEESRDGVNFSPVSQQAPQNTAGEHSYTAHIPVYSGKMFYRLKMLEGDNKISYSKTVLVKARRCIPEVTLRPNPVKNIFYIAANTIGSEYRIYNSTGTLLKKGIVTTASESVDASSLSPGTYYIAVDGAQIPFTKE